MRRIWRTAIRPTETNERATSAWCARDAMTNEPAHFDPATRRIAVRRTVWVVVGVVALIYGAFFVRAVLLAKSGVGP